MPSIVTVSWCQWIVYGGRDIISFATHLYYGFLYVQFKPMSVLFGMEMFANQDSQSEVLAPDSESDSD